MKVTRAWDYAQRLLPGAPVASKDALAAALSAHPSVVRLITRHVSREWRRVVRNRKGSRV